MALGVRRPKRGLRTPVRIIELAGDDRRKTNRDTEMTNSRSSA